MPSAATIQNLPSKFLCGWQKQFLAENWVLKTTKTKPTSPKQSGKWFFFFLIFFYIPKYDAENIVLLIKYSHE